MRLKYDFADKKELDLIHEYSMKMMEENGIIFACDEILEMFRTHGFRTDGQIVYMTEKDVREALKTCPATFEWYGRKSHLTVGGGKTICAPSYGPIYLLEDGYYHKIDRKRYTDFAKLNASSKVLDVSNPNMLDFSFIPEPYSTNWAMATVLMMDEKPAIGMVDGKKSAADSIKMTQDFYGIYDKPVVNSLISVASPCHYSTAMCEALIEYAKAGQAVFVTPSSMSGMTVPGSIASLLLSNNVETLSGIVAAQMVNPGAPVMYGIQSHGCDLRFGTPSIGSAEQVLIFSAAKAMGSYYNLPVRTGGSSCDAKQVDMQAGIESYATMYATIQSGADLMVHSCGSLESDSSVSFDKFIYDEEILQMVQRVNRGFEVSEETLLYDCFLEAGPGGQFLTLSDDNMEDSLCCYREDYLITRIANHVSHGTWEEHGRKMITDVTKEMWMKRLEDYQMPEITSEQKEVLAKYVPMELLFTEEDR